MALLSELDCEHLDNENQMKADDWLGPSYSSDTHTFFRPHKVETEDIEQFFPPELALSYDERDEFQKLVSKWKEETEHISSVSRMVAHPSYLAIIKMGTRYPNQIVPLLLKELRRRPDYWFAALETITSQSFSNPDADFDRERRDWLKWGKLREYL